MNISAITKAINGSALDESIKKDLIASLAEATSDEELLGKLSEAWEVVEKAKDGISQEIDETFEAVGIKIDPNDKETKAQMKELKRGVDEAKKKYQEKIDKLETKAEKIDKQAGKDLDDLATQNARQDLREMSV